ncbi:MAG TPA: FmdB family zinc ribbon protein [Terracidiphilus sp.]|nr:FmdB family zinc ribbon protein [Terracidiphilus sp.]
MPLYEYRCTQCGHHFEKIQSFNAQHPVECPKCHGPLERPLTAPALQFKGAGWYVNDYAGKGKATSTTPAASDKPAADAKPAADSRSAPAADSKPAASDSKSASSDSSSSKSSGSSSSSSSSGSSTPSTSA